ncbi:MAG TPA: hypothetical protein VK897_27165 [Anaerolineales bacterium]|nr:hypothetical protein [Anaerolineales bacterium]
MPEPQAGHRSPNDFSVAYCVMPEACRRVQVTQPTSSVELYFYAQPSNRIPAYKNPAIRPTPANPSMKNAGQQQHPRLSRRGRAERILDLVLLPTPRSRRPQLRPTPR